MSAIRDKLLIHLLSYYDFVSFNPQLGPTLHRGFGRVHYKRKLQGVAGLKPYSLKNVDGRRGTWTDGNFSGLSFFSSNEVQLIVEEEDCIGPS